MVVSATERDLFAAILADPEDDDARLIFADWCDSVGDPRGRFLRVQIALESVGEFDHRRASLERESARMLARHEKEWVKPVAGIATGATFRRGLIDGVKMTARQFAGSAAELFDRAPVRRLDLLDAGRSMEAVFASPYLGRLRELSLFALHLGHGPLVERLAGCQHLGRLKGLILGRNDLADDAATRLARSPIFSTIHELRLDENPLGDPGLSQLVERATELRRIDISRTGATATGLSLLAEFAARGPLESVAARGLPAIGYRGAASATWLQIPDLDLSECELTLLTIDRILPDRPMPIRRLVLASNRLGDGGATRLAHSSALENLRRLDLRHNDIRDAGAEAIAASIPLRRLLECHVGFNPIGPAGWSAFLAPHALPQCRRFGLPVAGVADGIVHALAEKFR
jgi:uncharacterized protein (TIGR02996 family)